jgi:seryl-tRNA synthetase
MFDIKILRDDAQRVKTAMEHRGADVDIEKVTRLDERRRALVSEVEQLKNERNVASKEIGRLKKAGEDAAGRQQAVRELGARIKELDEQVRECDEALHQALLAIPNVPHESVPVGPDASGNRLVRSWGEKQCFDFEPRPHWELGAELGIFDFERAARMSGAGFPLYRGMGAKLERALIQFMLDLHVSEHGYEEVSTPFMCTSDATRGTGQLPKLAEDMYYIPTDDLYLIPTAEVPVTNIYREEIIEEPLPIFLTAYSPCFRREAGAAGKDTRGLNRVHQFDKVEMVKFVEPETSYNELERLLVNAEDVLQKLELPYRVLELCTGDLSFASAKCYDIELWAPGQQAWLEVSSCSNFEDFQARRAGIKYRLKNGRSRYVHTLNGSGVALARLVVALLEGGQQKDGSVILPEILAPYLGGNTRISSPRVAGGQAESS